MKSRADRSVLFFFVFSGTVVELTKSDRSDCPIVRTVVLLYCFAGTICSLNSVHTPNLVAVLVHHVIVDYSTIPLAFQPAVAVAIDISPGCGCVTVCDEAGIGTGVGADTGAGVGCTSVVAGISSGT